MQKILVTGGAGMIGLEVCRQLAALDYTVHLFDLGEQIKRVEKHLPHNLRIYYGSILDHSSLRLAMAGCGSVIHLGAMLGVKRTEADKLRCIEINVEGTKNVLESAALQNVKKIVFASSSEVYGEPSKNPITEDLTTQGKTVYAVTKLAGEELCKAYAQQYPLEYTILRYFNSYGPYQTAQFVITKFISNVLSGKPPIINGDGNQVRSYTYVSDTAKATILAALSSKTNQEILNIGNGETPVRLKELADLVIDIGGKKGELSPEYRTNFEQADRERSREIYERFCDSTKAQHMLEWTPEITLEQGIREIMNIGVIFQRWESLYDEQN